jgi:uncharacterized protein YciI
MKRAFVTLVLLAAVSLQAQGRYPAPADMQTVHVALLYRGPNATTESSPETQKIQEAHLAHIVKMAKAGQALIAGPMGGDGDLRGLIFLKAASADAARALEAEDPAVKAGRLRIEIVSLVSPANWFSFGPVKDDLPMRQFVFAFLNDSGKNTAPPDPTLIDDHLANLWSLRESGVMVGGGPVIDSMTRAGVVIMAIDSVAKAKAILEQDPTVKTGRNTVELFSWYAADGIMKGK